MLYTLEITFEKPDGTRVIIPGVMTPRKSTDELETLAHNIIAGVKTANPDWLPISGRILWTILDYDTMTKNHHDMPVPESWIPRETA